MLSQKVKRKLESFTDLPAIPIVIADVLKEIDNPNFNVKTVSTLIEQDQGLTARILRVANSPLYGLVRKISTVDLAIVILGANILKEILISLLLHRVFRNIKLESFDIRQFWHYSIFCGAASRFLARKLNYKLVSEAFVAGLIHDIGILILIDKFRNNFNKVRKLQASEGYTIIEAEMHVFECTHSDVGAWFAERWNFPEQIVTALYNHHTPFFIADKIDYEDDFIINPSFKKIEHPLSAIVSLSEWLSFECNNKQWDAENTQPNYYISNELVFEIVDNDSLTYDSALTIIKQSLIDEYENAVKVLSFG
ncbi:MAG: HDOD domain-containing protein [Ignavibacteria bacterium]|jgi:HD-like signal output (HDOD) protein|nr:HDOD domain-containing protein [Ignavibacteria bacterium]